MPPNFHQFSCMINAFLLLKISSILAASTLGRLASNINSLPRFFPSHHQSVMRKPSSGAPNDGFGSRMSLASAPTRLRNGELAHRTATSRRTSWGWLSAGCYGQPEGWLRHSSERHFGSNCRATVLLPGPLLPVWPGLRCLLLNHRKRKEQNLISWKMDRTTAKKWTSISISEVVLEVGPLTSSGNSRKWTE